MYSIVLAAALTAGGESPRYSSVYVSAGCWGCGGCAGCQGWGCGCGWQGWYGSWGGSGCSGLVVFSACCGIFPPNQHHNEHLFIRPHSFLAPAPEPIPAPAPDAKPAPPEKKLSGDRALLNVAVAADARLYINDRLMQTTSTRRSFDTPPLEKGKTYHYTLRAEVVRDGKIVSETREVAVKAGQVTRTSLLSRVREVAVSRP